MAIRGLAREAGAMAMCGLETPIGPPFALPRGRLRRLRPSAWLAFLGGGLGLAVGAAVIGDQKAVQPALTALGVVATAGILIGIRMHRPTRQLPWHLLAACTALTTTGVVCTGGPLAIGTWCQRTILPARTRITARAWTPGPSHRLAGRSPRTNVAVTLLPRLSIRTIRPEHGSPAFHSTASARLWKRCSVPPWMISAFVANRSAALSLSPALSAELQARTTLSGDAALPPQEAPISASVAPMRSRNRTLPRL